MIVPDATADPRFSDNPLVIGEPHIRAYIGTPITTPDGYNIGTLCAIDQKPRQFTAKHEQILSNFAALVMNEIELRRIAAHDVLTGLATRRTFQNAMASVMTAIRSSSSETATIATFEIEHFQSIGQSNQAVTDDILQTVGRVVRQSLRSEDLAARMDEQGLAIMMFGLDEESAGLEAEKLRAEIEAAVASRHPHVTFTSRFGVAEINRWWRDADAWLAAATRALRGAEATAAGRTGSITSLRSAS